MPYLKVYTHLVWTTKNREPYLSTPELRAVVWKHIKDYGLTKGIIVDQINGFTQHCHCLVLLNATMPISKVLHLLKGESSHWINEQGLCVTKFEWQNDYWGVSVGLAELTRIREYICNQEDHHMDKSFDDECKDLDIHFED